LTGTLRLSKGEGAEMNCNKVRTQLSAYLDRELPADQAEEVRSHLAKCPGCTEEYRLLCAAWDALLADKGIEPSPDFIEALWQRVRGREAEAIVPGPGHVRLLKWLPAMAAGLVVAFLAGWISAGVLRRDEAAEPPAELAFLRDYDVIEQMDLLEDLPIIQAVDLGNGEGGIE
jgi:anti-sigma factor (TIGR02949 family)